MIVFVVPLKGRQVSKSWQRVCQLFERSVKSICNQTSSDYRVIVVCNEKPDIEFNHSYITYLEVDFPLSNNEPTELSQKETDKGRKILAGLTAAKEYSPSHTMTVDADDCISNRIAEYVNKHPLGYGWYINTGYKYFEGSQWVYIKRKNFYRMSGTCNIVRYDLNDLPENPEYNRGYGYYKLFIDHQKIPNLMKKKKHPLNLYLFPVLFMSLAQEKIFLAMKIG
jgi:hypothetical protein